MDDTDSRADSASANSSSNRSFPLWVVWGGLLASMLIYGVIIQVMDLGGTMEAGQFRTFLIALSVVAASEIPVIVLLRRVLFFSRLDEGEFDEIEMVEQGYFTTSIMTWALSESIVIYGFVLAFFSGDITYYLPFAGVGIILMIIYRPELEAQIDAFEAQTSSTSGDAPDDGTSNESPTTAGEW